MKKIVSFLASGRGSNFTAVAKNIAKDKINAHLGILLTDNLNAGAVDHAKKFGMKSYFMDPKGYPDRESLEKDMIKQLESAGTDLVVAAGYMRMLGKKFVSHYKNRIINIHPALLPSFPGIHSQKQAFDYGVKITGCTTHFIDEGMDSGPIIMQAVVEINSDDSIQSISDKILMEEHRILPESVRLFCEERILIEGRKVIILSR